MLSLTVGLFYVFIFCATNCEVIRGDPRIIGGGEVNDRGKFAYQALLYINNDGTGFCGGAIINEMYILTAASCVYNLAPTDISVAVGQLDLDDRNVTKHVESISIHEDFAQFTSTNNIAVLKLEQPFDSWTDNINFITLRTTDSTDQIETCVVSGWGTTSSALNNMNKKLNYVEISILKCSPNTIGGTLCEGDSTKGACKGDNGGPLVCTNELAGILSYVDGTCSTPSYTEISKYVDWICSKAGCPTESSSSASTTSTTTGGTNSSTETVTKSSDNTSESPSSPSTASESTGSDSTPETPSNSTESLTTTVSTSLVTSESDSGGNYTTPKSTSTTTITTTPSSSPSSSAAPPQAADANPDFINSTAFIVIVVLLTVLILVALLILVIVTMLRRTRLY